MVKVEIDEGSGFCNGVVAAIRKAEEALSNNSSLYCLGDIVHNNDEVSRLESKGMVTINHEQLANISGEQVLLRAHGEPPSTYTTAQSHNIEIIDATCPVVLKLQQRIKRSYTEATATRQIVIYGKLGHAEVNGLVGQTDGNAIVIQNTADLDKIDFTKDIDLYSQTPMSVSGFKEIIDEIERRRHPQTTFRSFDTICRQVANRVDNLRRFAAEHSLIIFVSGPKSSNGKFLFEECLAVNPQTKMVSGKNDFDSAWLNGIESVGICGATSTPRWLMENVKFEIEQLIAKSNNEFN